MKSMLTFRDSFFFDPGNYNSCWDARQMDTLSGSGRVHWAVQCQKFWTSLPQIAFEASFPFDLHICCKVVPFENVGYNIISVCGISRSHLILAVAGRVGSEIRSSGLVWMVYQLKKSPFWFIPQSPHLKWGEMGIMAKGCEVIWEESQAFGKRLMRLRWNYHQIWLLHNLKGLLLTKWIDINPARSKHIWPVIQFIVPLQGQICSVRVFWKYWKWLRDWYAYFVCWCFVLYAYYMSSKSVCLQLIVA